MIDFHSHLVPCVDDGARNLGEARTALATLREQGVTTLITTPHLRGALIHHPDRLRDTLAILDEGWEKLLDLSATEFPELRVERRVEIILDAPDSILSERRCILLQTAFDFAPGTCGVPIRACRMASRGLSRSGSRI